MPCECNGHGDPLQGYCHNHTGQCYCTHNTQGPHCESCLPGYYGDPRCEAVLHVTLHKYHIQVRNRSSVPVNRNNGTCYRQCQGRSVLLSPASASAMPFSSSLGWRSGAEGKGGLSHCLWVLSVTEKLAPCQPRQLCPPVALTLHPDSHTHCKVSGNICLTTIISSIIFLCKCLFHIFMIFQSSFVYVFDGLPRFLSNGVVHSDHNLIGAFCGTTRAQPITVEATSGNILQL